MQLWWEIHERYESKLLSHTQFETDEDSMDDLIHIEKPATGKKKKVAKGKKAAPSETPSEDAG